MNAALLFFIILKLRFIDLAIILTIPVGGLFITDFSLVWQTVSQTDVDWGEDSVFPNQH